MPDNAKTGSSHPSALTPEDVQLIRTALIGMAAVGEKVTNSCLGETPPAASRAHVYFESDERDSFPYYTVDAFLVMQTANLSGFDHTRAFVKLIGATSSRSTALVTLARGALEAFARTWFLLEAQDGPDFVHRHLSLLYEESRYPALFGEPVRLRTGEEFDPMDVRTHLGAEFTRLGLPPPSRIAYGTIVGDLLDSAHGDKGGKQHYSDLSSVAHGHRMAINRFILLDGTGEISSLAADRTTTTELAFHLFEGSLKLMNTLIAFFGNGQRNVDLVAAAADRAADCFSQIAGTTTLSG